MPRFGDRTSKGSWGNVGTQYATAGGGAAARVSKDDDKTPPKRTEEWPRNTNSQQDFWKAINNNNDPVTVKSNHPSYDNYVAFMYWLGTPDPETGQPRPKFLQNAKLDLKGKTGRRTVREANVLQPGGNAVITLTKNGSEVNITITVGHSIVYP